MRLIDADALLNHVWDADTRCGYVQVVDRGDIEEAPTAVELVRCRDCKHWSRGNYGYCFVHASYGMAPDDFCSYGEREE